jgi:hypothetical protein
VQLWLFAGAQVEQLKEMLFGSEICTKTGFIASIFGAWFSMSVSNDALQETEIAFWSDMKNEPACDKLYVGHCTFAIGT